jgi:hypothetical protein
MPAKDTREHLDETVNFSLCDDQRRHKTQNMVAGIINQQSSGETVAYHYFCIDVEFHPLEQAEPAYIPYDAVAVFAFRQAFRQIVPHPARVIKHVAL